MMTQKQYQKWKQIRAKGRVRYILVDGILEDGSLFALLSMLLNHLWKHGLTWSIAHNFSLTNFIPEFVFKAVFFGGFLALWRWSANEKKYKEYERNAEQQTETE